MLTTKSFLKQLIELGYRYVRNFENGTIDITKNGDTENTIVTVYENIQFSKYHKQAPWNLKELVWRYEKVKVRNRSGFYLIPLKNISLGGQKYIYFNKVTEKFGVTDLTSFSSEDLIIYFTKEELNDRYLKESIGEYLKWVVEA